MEISVIGSSQVKFIGRVNNIGVCNFSRKLSANLNNNSYSLKKICNFGENTRLLWSSRNGIRVSASAQNQADAVVVSHISSKFAKNKPSDGVKLYVGLPLDTVSNCHTINHARAIAAGLKALKLLGVDGVELPVWWGIAENEAMGKYDWTGYLAIVEMVQSLGLKVHISLCFHASKESKISLPHWVSRIGESEPGIYFMDRSGQQYKECLSLGVDELPVLDGKTPLEVYKEFCENFKSSFSPFMGSTITGITIGLGPDGELRYPSHHHPTINNGPGEFQCYDINMLNNLKHHAEMHGNPLRGLGGPHDAPSYDQSPISGGFFTENGGSWESPYGDFFLSWYSSQLVRHANNVLAIGNSTFKDGPRITLSGKIPIMPSWYKTRSHPSELTAGFYNTANRDGYDCITEIFSRNSCKIVLPRLDLSDENQPNESQSSPEFLLGHILSSCMKHGVKVSGQNSFVSGGSRGFEQVEKTLLSASAIIDLFMYQRMGAYFFSPEHFPSFTQFVRGLNEPMQSLDDLPVGDEDNAQYRSGPILSMQTA